MLSFAIDRRIRRIIDSFEVHRHLPVDIEGVARRMGWKVHYQHDLMPIYGIADCRCGKRQIVINADLSLPWQRATLGHEIGHWIAGHLQDGERMFSQLDTWHLEDEDDATTIAAVLLIPRTALTPDSTRLEIMETCLVPLELVRHRLYMT